MRPLTKTKPTINRSIKGAGKNGTIFLVIVFEIKTESKVYVCALS
jgi:hypothetical protein